MSSKLFQITLFFFATIFSVSAQDSNIDMLVPDFGIVPGTNEKNGTCEGFDGIRIDCHCPPTKSKFIMALINNNQKGYAADETHWPVSFPTGDDDLSKAMRINAFIATLLNINGTGQGCSVYSTNLTALFASAPSNTSGFIRSSTTMPFQLSTSMLMPIPSSTMSSSTFTTTTSLAPYP